jgi:hypothetical protein
MAKKVFSFWAGRGEKLTLGENIEVVISQDAISPAVEPGEKRREFKSWTIHAGGSSRIALSL